MVSKQEEENKLALIPKSEKYIEYMLDIMIKLPRTEKFSIGTEYKQSMYKMLEEIMLLNKVKNKYKPKDIKKLKAEKLEHHEDDIAENIEEQKQYNQYRQEILHILNTIDSRLNTQRIYLRIMKRYKWIDEKKFRVAMELIYEIGKILGGLIKYYAKNN